MSYISRRISPIKIQNLYDAHKVFKETVTLFTIHCLIDCPTSIVDYAAEYFDYLKTKQASMIITESGDLYSDDHIEVREFIRHKVVYSESYNPEEDESVSDVNVVHKTQSQKDIVLPRVKTCLLFRTLDHDDLERVIQAMVLRITQPQEVIVKQDDEGDNFYVIETGVFEAYVTDDDEQKLINVYNNTGEFGELALMYNQPRAATVISATEGRLWALDRVMFRKIVLKAAFRKRKLYESFIEMVPMLEPLDTYERMSLADSLTPQYFKDGESIIEQGETAKGMYFVERGEVKVMMFDKKSMQVNLVGPGGYFGELALLLKKPRAATVIAIGDVKVAFLDVDAFERLLGSCIAVMRRNLPIYEDQVAKIFGNKASILAFARE